MLTKGSIKKTSRNFQHVERMTEFPIDFQNRRLYAEKQVM